MNRFYLSSLLLFVKKTLLFYLPSSQDLEVEKSKAFADTIAAGRDAAVAHEQMEQYRQQLDNMTTELQTKYATLSSVQHENDVRFNKLGLN